MVWHILDGRPIWQQLHEQLTQAIATGSYPLGTRLPGVRDLASEAGVNPNTMQRALAQLEVDGLVITNRTAGRTVTDDPAILEQAKNQLATVATQAYLAQMTKIGFCPGQIQEKLKEEIAHV